MGLPAASHISGVDTAYVPEQSIQMSAASNQYFTRTPTKAEADRTRGIFVAWVKFAGQQTPSYYERLFFADGGSQYTSICRNTGGTPSPDYTALSVFHDGYLKYQTACPLRDVTAHYPLLVSIDTNAAAGDRVRFYRGHDLLPVIVNNEFSFADVMEFGNTVPHYLLGDAAGSPFDGVATQPRWLPGVSVQNGDFTTYDFFGEDDAGNPVPIPPAADVYGTTGWLIEDSTGTDQSGNGNDWMPINAPMDSSDVPGDDASLNLGNYARWSAIDKGSSVTVSGAAWSMTAPETASGWRGVRSTVWMPGGSDMKVYAELAGGIHAAARVAFGFANAKCNPNVYTSYNYLGTWAYEPYDGYKCDNGVTSAPWYVERSGANQPMKLAIDMGAKKAWIGFVGGAWQGGGDPELGTSPSFAWTGDDAKTLFAECWGGSWRLCTEEDDWAGMPPAGFNPLCTAHLPEKTPVDPGAQMGVGLYTGTGGSITQAITGLGFQPDFVFVKNRSRAYNWVVFDALRGAGNRLMFNQTSAEDTGGGSGVVSSFDSDGFTVDGQTSGENINYLNDNYVWTAIGGLIHMTSGEIASLVSSTGATITPTGIAYDADLGFAILTYTGNGSAGATLPNPLGQAPGMMIVKHLGAATYWYVYHFAIGGTKYLALQTTGAAATSTGAWNDTDPTTNLVTLGDSGAVNDPADYVIYLFANTDAIKVGSYVGNGSADGPFVDMGGAPIFTLMKNSSAVGNWHVVNTVVSPGNPVDDYLLAESSAPENTTSAHQYDALASGVKIRNDSTNTNGGGNPIIYIALLDTYFGGANVTQGKAH